MQNNPSPSALLSLKSAIDPRPLTVTPDTLLTDVITMMGKAFSGCVLPGLKLPLELALMSEARASSVLVMAGEQLIGVFTQRDAVKVIASKGENLAQVKISAVMTSPVVAVNESEADVFTALSLMRQHQIRHLPVLDSRHQLVGIVTLERIRQALPPELLKLRSVAEVAHTPVIYALVSASALSLAQLMAEQQASYVVITKADSENDILPVGIVTEGDLVQLQALQLDLSQMQAQTIMRTPLLSVLPTDAALVASWEMQQSYTQQLLVWEKPGEVLGIFTPTSFLQSLPLAEIYSTLERLHRDIEQFEVEKAEVEKEINAAPLPNDKSTKEVVEQLERNRLLATIALRIRESLNLDEILKTAVNEVRQFLQTDRVIIYHLNPDLSGTVVVESVAPGWQPALGSTVKDNCFATEYIDSYKEGRIQVTEDIYRAGLTQCHINILAVFDIRANLVVPIIQGEKLWGLLCAYHCSQPRYWRQFEVDLLKQLATHVAIAIQQSELYQQLEAELTERKQAESQIKASLKEKEVLLKEIHHRVKNNLQIISSLLKLQSSYTKDEQTLAMFKDSQNRIRSMALIHEKLYQSKNLSNIDFAEYIRDLTKNLLRSYGANSQNISLQANVNDILLNIDTAIPCGLIINELISNSLKHAFPVANQKSEIYISIQTNENRTFTLIIRDNGVGLPPELDFRKTESLGLELVCTLTEQLDGTIELDRTSGTKFKIMFSEIGNT